MFLECTVPPNSKETELEISNQEASPSAGKSSGCHVSAAKYVPTAISDGVGYGDNFKLVFFFFYKKVLSLKKNTKTLNNKGNIFYARKIFEEGESCLFCVLLLFLRSKPFCKKNVNRLEIVPIASSYYTTTLIVLYYYSEHLYLF